LDHHFSHCRPRRNLCLICCLADIEFPARLARNISHLTMPSNLVLNHLTVSSFVTLCCLPILLLHRLLFATRAPGRLLNHVLAVSRHRHISVDSHAAVEVHAIDTNCRVILDAKIDVFRDTETKVTSIREILLSQLIFLDLKTSL
jgi:hypothetical protein